MEIGRASVVALVVALALTPVVAGGQVTGSAATTGVDPGVDATTSDTQVETDRVRLVVDVAADGDAVWQVQYRTDLDDPNTSAAFESLAEDIEADPANYTDRFADRIQRTVASAENTTEREMSVRNVSVSARVESLTGDVGVVTYTYEWTGFARVDGDRLVVGDAIAGFFLNDRTLLQVQWPEEYGVTDVGPAPDSQSGRSLSWDGSETDFGPDQPTVVVAEGVTTTATGPGGDGSDGVDGDGSTDGDGGGDLSLVAVAVVALAAVVAVVAVLARRSGGATPVSGDDAGDDGTGVTPGDAGGADEASSDDAGGAGDDGDGEDQPPVDDELLSNEERVLRLLERRGGRIKQQEVVEALDWTEAKTSQVVSGMRDEGTIEGFRLGRENVLTLPGQEIAPGDEEGDDQ